MIFAEINKGHYWIIQDKVVIAEINQVSINRKYLHPHLWGRRQYIIAWYNRPDDKELFKTLPDIQDKYQFQNFPAYGKILRRKNDNRN